MSAPFLHIDVKPAPGDRFQVTAKIEGAARIERTVMASALPFYLQSLGELAAQTETHRGRRLIVESPDVAHA